MESDYEPVSEHYRDISLGEVVLPNPHAEVWLDGLAAIFRSAESVRPLDSAAFELLDGLEPDQTEFLASQLRLSAEQHPELHVVIQRREFAGEDLGKADGILTLRFPPPPPSASRKMTPRAERILRAALALAEAGAEADPDAGKLRVHFA
jgi:hypothetical protein